MFYIFPRAVPKKECRKLLKYCIKNTKFEDASVLNKGSTDSGGKEEIERMVDDRSRIDPKVRKTDVGFITGKDNRVNEIAWHFLREANKITFNYKLEYFQPVQFARYRNGGHYGWHQDSSGASASGEARKLSLTFSLSDPKTYEGGYLEFFLSRPMHESWVKDIRAQGSIVVFDSRDYHRVTPCIKGTRYSIVCWTIGPNFI